MINSRRQGSVTFAAISWNIILMFGLSLLIKWILKRILCWEKNNCRWIFMDGYLIIKSETIESKISLDNNVNCV